MLTVGQEAKDFTLLDKDAKAVSLSDFKGQKVVLYFYAKDDTPGCTKRACSFRDAYAEFATSKVTVIGISRDSAESHQRFAEKFQLPFILLADPDGAVTDAYDVNGALGAKRATYVVSEQGIIEKVLEKANPEENAADILEYLRK